MAKSFDTALFSADFDCRLFKIHDASNSQLAPDAANLCFLWRFAAKETIRASRSGMSSDICVMRRTIATRYSS